MNLVVASGKGGTGKTTVAVNLARVMTGTGLLLDCDVEEPNTHIFLPGKVVDCHPAHIQVPVILEDKCNHCGLCARFCQFNAMVSLAEQTLVFPELCHSCGGCARLCPSNAIREREQRVGVVETSQCGNITLVQGRLDVGVATVPPLIQAVKAHLRPGIPAILDAPPGTACPAVATLTGADFAILVTEPTPFGLHDLRLAVDLVRELSVEFGVVINRKGIGDNRVHTFCIQENIPILSEIPDDRKIFEAYSKGQLVVDYLPQYRSTFEQLLERVIHLAGTSHFFATEVSEMSGAGINGGGQ